MVFLALNPLFLIAYLLLSFINLLKALFLSLGNLGVIDQGLVPLYPLKLIFKLSQKVLLLINGHSHLLYLLIEVLGHCLLMVAKSGHFKVANVVEVNLLFLDLNFIDVLSLLVELILESDRGIISTEDLGTQTLHQVLKVVIKSGGIDQIEKVIVRILP